MGFGSVIVLLGFVLLLSLLELGQTQLSDPIANDEVFDVGSNKYLTRSAAEPKSSSSSHDEEPMRSTECPVDLELAWMTEVSSSVYATPIITDLYSDGTKEIIVPSFVHYLEALEAEHGAKSMGWPVNHKSTLHNSPVIADCDFDGVPDVVIVTYSGEILCYSDTGRRLAHYHISGLEVRKDWYVGLKPDHVDHDHPDVSDSDGEGMLKDILGGDGGRRQHDDAAGERGEGKDEGGGGGAARSRRSLLQAYHHDPTDDQNLQNLHANTLSGEAQDSFEVFNEDDKFDFASDEEGEEEGEDLLALHPDEYDEVYDDYGDEEVFRHDLDLYDDPYLENWDEDYYDHMNHHPEGRVEDYITLDPHVLCTPTVVDIDGDGYEDLVIAVTYLFDHEVYSDPERRDELGDDIDISNYLAGGVLVFDFFTNSVKWHQHLDLSTHHVNFQAYMYSSPTVADIDADGKPEIVVGTSVGFVYVLDQNGTSMPGWPIQMGEVQAQVVVEDINDDGVPEILACDSKGNVAAFNTVGREIWERHLGSLIANSPTVGDVNGDGKTELVVGTGSGTIFVLDGGTGRITLSYQTNAMIMSSVLLAKLDNSAENGKLHMVTMSFDGFLYLVDGSTGCADVVDIGETSYSMVLYEDLDNDGYMDLLVSTMNGNVYSFKTKSRHDPLKTWTAQVHSGNGFGTKLNRESVAFTPESRAPRDVSGKKFSLSFEISDKLLPNADATAMKGLSGPYAITVKLKGIGVEEMNSGKNPVVGVSHTFEYPGIYTLEIPCPMSRTTGTVEILMTDKFGKMYSDSISLSFHMSYYRILKWLLALPMVLMGIVVIQVSSVLTKLNLPS